MGVLEMVVPTGCGGRYLATTDFSVVTFFKDGRVGGGFGGCCRSELGAAQVFPWLVFESTLQCKLGARVPLVPRNQWHGRGRVLYVPPPRYSALELLGWVPPSDKP